MKINSFFFPVVGGGGVLVQMENGEPVPLLIAAGGGGKAYLEQPESSLEQIPLEQYENDTLASGVNGRTGAAGLHLTFYLLDRLNVSNYHFPAENQ